MQDNPLTERSQSNAVRLQQERQPAEQSLTLQSNLLTQNAVLLQTIREHPEKQIKAEPSVYGNEPPATTDELASEVERLMSAFPQMKDEFFAYVMKEAARRGISRNRMEYIVNTIFETYHYPTITMADIFDIDRYIHELTPSEFYSLTIPHKPLAQISFGGKYRIVYKEDADAYGYKSTPFLSNAEREEKERLADERRHQQWIEQWQKDHPNEVPDTKDIDIIIGELSEEFSVNQKS